MITKAFAVYDSKAVVYGTPFFMGAVGLAVRAFTDLVNDPKSSVSRYPEDFSLFELADFDDTKGVFIPKIPVNLGLASGYVKSVKSVTEVR